VCDAREVEYRYQRPAKKNSLLANFLLIKAMESYAVKLAVTEYRQWFMWHQLLRRNHFMVPFSIELQRSLFNQ